MSSTTSLEINDKDTKTYIEKVDEVAAAQPVEDNLSVWECIKQNPKICLYTLWANIGSFMIGYEQLVLSVCLAMPAFQMTYSEEVNGVMLIPAHWQSLWNGLYNVMQVVGSIAAGPLQDWFGRRAMFLFCSIIAAAGIAIAFVANTHEVFLAAKIVTGFALGASVVATQTYVSEVTPLPVRGIALSINTVALNLGMLIGISSTFSRISIMNDMAYRVVFAAAWAFPGAWLIGLPFVPESPYWLVSKNKLDKARKALARLVSKHENVETRLSTVQHTVELERAQKSQQGSIIECFKGTNLRRTFITLICFHMAITVGSVLSANSPYFLYQAGLASNTVLTITQVGISVGVASAIVNLFLMSKFNHRILIFGGLIVCCLAYLTMGIAGAMARTPTTSLVVGIALQFSTLSYGPAVGGAMAVAGEVSSTRLRAKTIGLGNGFMGVSATFWQFVLPYLFNSDQADLGGNLGWIFFGIIVIHGALIYFFVPGTKGRSFEELDIMFDQKLSARRFEKYDFRNTNTVV